MKGPELRAERNRERIVKAATQAFMSRGIKKVSISDIARDAGVTPATVYNQFGSKEELIRESVKFWYRSILEDSRAVYTEGDTFLEKMQNLLAFKSEWAGKIHGEFTVMASSDDPVIREFMETEFMAAMYQSVNQFFDEGREQGYVDPEISNEMILRFTEIIRRGINADMDAAADPEYTIKLVKQITPLILYGILGNQAKKQMQ